MLTIPNHSSDKRIGGKPVMTVEGGVQFLEHFGAKMQKK
jgi:hypothetical protein